MNINMRLSKPQTSHSAKHTPLKETKHAKTDDSQPRILVSRGRLVGREVSLNISKCTDPGYDRGRINLTKEKTIVRFSHSKRKYTNKGKLLTQPSHSLNKMSLGSDDKLSQCEDQTTESESNTMEIHKEILKKIDKCLNTFELEQRIENIERQLLKYYDSEINLEEYIQERGASKEMYNLLNLERTFVIVLIEFCLNTKINLILRNAKEIMKNILEQYARISKSNPNIKCTDSKLRFKTRNPNFLVKSQNFKIFEMIKKISNQLDINSSLKELLKNLEPTHPKRFWYLLKEYYAYHLALVSLEQINLREDYWPLAVCPQPYLPAYSGYTLVLDLDETLAHYTPKGKVLIRPYANQFLKTMKKYYQIVIFTAGMPDYADYLLCQFQAQVDISHKLYRYHTSRIRSQKSIKDLTRLGRPLDKIVMIDNIKDNFVKQLYNGVEIKSWYGEPNDSELKKLMKPLIHITEHKLDARQYIKQVFYFE